MAALSAPSFAASSLGEDVVGVLDIDGERCVVARATVNKLSGLEGLTAEQVNERHSMQVLTWYRGADLEILPASNTVLQSGDCIKLFGTDDAFEKLFKRSNVDETPP